MSAPIHQPKRRWFQFSMRTLLLAVALLCVILAAVLGPIQRQRRAVRAIKAAYGFARYEPKAGGVAWIVEHSETRLPIEYRYDVVSIDLQDAWKTDAATIGLPHLSRLRCVDASSSDITDRGLAHLADCTALELLDLRGTAVSDVGLKHLRYASSLRDLLLSRTRISDDGLAELAGLAELERIGLTETLITDAGLAHLSRAQRLKHIVLRNCQVTDAGLMHLEKLRELTHVSLAGTQVSGRGLRHLASLDNLQYLDVSNTSVTDDDLASLFDANPRRVHAIRVYARGSRVTAAWVRELNARGGSDFVELSYFPGTTFGE